MIGFVKREPDMAEAGIVYAFAVKDGVARPVRSGAHDAAADYVWVHLNLATEPGRQWVQRSSGMAAQLATTFLDRTEEPGITSFGNGLLVVLEDRLREFDHSTQELSELHIWVEAGRIITARWRPLAGTDRLRFRLEVGTGPASAGEFLIDLLDEIVDDLEAISHRTRRRLDLLEDEVLDERAAGVAGELGSIRRASIQLRRRVLPLRQLLGQLADKLPAWGGRHLREPLEPVLGRVDRVGGEIMAGQEQARLLQDEIAARNAERSGRNLYIISVLTAIMLPLNLITGVFGMNVAGLPGLHDDMAFTWVMAGMLGLIFGVVAIFKLRRWF